MQNHRSIISCIVTYIRANICLLNAEKSNCLCERCFLDGGLDLSVSGNIPMDALLSLVRDQLLCWLSYTLHVLVLLRSDPTIMRPLLVSSSIPLFNSFHIHYSPNGSNTSAILFHCRLRERRNSISSMLIVTHGLPTSLTVSPQSHYRPCVKNDRRRKKREWGGNEKEGRGVGEEEL